ncbi:hypothetical protein [Pseudolactococcus insecticola]|uniref:Uncharacterized protein n=1 Tax=Pseudolactococcus insecticola TaxID=2709158 RepID=A0A6A0B893_9LACT|nr:hypothetical protein [Lactococcus insecticola]GFH40604.1 hypothetical protein Hs20B_10020 [Lactococcus insecticola]
MENSYPQNNRHKVTFPIIPDDAVLTPDNRVIMTNQQFLTRNPDAQTERFGNQAQQATNAANTASQQTQTAAQGQSADNFERRRQTPTTAGKRPLGTNSRMPLVDEAPKKKSYVEEAKKRARENAVAPKPVKPYVNPLERASSDELGIRDLANKKVVKAQHSLSGQALAGFDKAAAQRSSSSLFDAPEQDYFASKHSNRDSFDIVD